MGEWGRSPEQRQELLANFRWQVGYRTDSWCHEHGRTVRDLAAVLFPDQPDAARWRWLRRALAQGFMLRNLQQRRHNDSEQKLKNTPELERLHEFFGLAWGDLWETPSLPERLFVITHWLAPDDPLRAEISEQIDEWEQEVRGRIGRSRGGRPAGRPTGTREMREAEDAGDSSA